MRNTRRIGKKDMALNDALPSIAIDPERYVVTIDGERIEPRAAADCRSRRDTFFFEEVEMSETITIQQLPSAAPPPPEAVVVHLPMTAHDRRRVRRLIDAPDGARLALELATGTVLLPGQVIHRSPARAYVVSAALEDVLVARPRDLEEAARIGHLMGNLHRDIETRDRGIIALADAALADRLRRAGVPFANELRAFHGRAPGEHSALNSLETSPPAAAAAVRLAVPRRRVRAFGRHRDLRRARRIAAGVARCPRRANRAGLGTERTGGRAARMGRVGRRPSCRDSRR